MATPDKPSQSSSNGSKNGSGDNALTLIVIAAIVVLAVQYFLTGTNFALDIWEELTAPELSKAEIAEFEETLDQIDQNAATYASGGFQTEEDVKNAIAAQKSYAKELEAQGVVSSYTADDNSVYFKFENGLSYLYIAAPEGTDALSTDSEATVCSVETTGRADSLAAISTVTSAFSATSSKWSASTAKTPSNITLAGLKELGGKQQLLIWAGHGGYNRKTGSVLDTGIDSDLSDKAQLIEIKNDRATIVNVAGDPDSHLAITPSFVKRYVRGLGGSVVYLCACSTGEDSQLADAFLDNGATAVFGNTGSISHVYNVAMLQSVLTTFLTPDENGNYPTLSKALSTAKKTIGGDSAEYLERVGADANFIESQRNVKVKLFGGTEAGDLKVQADSTSKGKTTTGDTSSGSTSSSSSSSSGKETESKSSESSGGSSANSGLPATESKQSESTGGGASANSGSSASSSGQTAPMPETTLTNDMIVGLWSPDPNAEEPRYIDFHTQGDLVIYDYYSLIDSRALGRPQPSAPVKFEFCNGVVDMMLNQGRCSCLTKDSSGVYISFYIDEMANDVIYDQETGTAWHRVIPHVIENH
ncbi:hypothetical protein [uncultured Senegalimassilia sp.]|uniref:hypothetical protein n=1 Tax=uncultured Senegalimassilia sp. TaxID=1714350 RepID=UPI0025D7408A|nr:hypothetical protein [uncultured Senegalimassilia sp.]